jgi:hypothetical protein
VPPAHLQLPTRTIGHAILTAGLALLLEPTPAGFVAAFVLGLLVGLLKLLEFPTPALIVPMVASFATAAIVFGTAPYLHVDNPIRLLVAPLVTSCPAGCWP